MSDELTYDNIKLVNDGIASDWLALDWQKEPDCALPPEALNYISKTREVAYTTAIESTLRKKIKETLEPDSNTQKM